MLRPAANPKHGCIIHRLRRSAALLATALALLAAPAMALANPLLSGYGGPGQGEQAILGGGLVNGPAGGSGGSGGSTAISTAPSEAAGTTTSGHASPNQRGRTRARSRRERHPAGSTNSAVPSNGSAANGSASRLPARAANSNSSQLLGLSSEDVVYAVLAVVLLIAAAAAIGRLAAPPSLRESAKGKERISRVVK